MQRKNSRESQVRLRPGLTLDSYAGIQTIGLAFGIALLAFLAHSRGLSNDFILRYDDDQYITDNKAVQQGLSTYGLTYAFTRPVASNWHPLTILSLMADTSIFGTGPFGYHLTNLLLHVINAALAFHVFQRLTGERWRSAALAAIFAVHPIHVASVASIAQRKDVLSGMFWLLGTLAYVRYVERPAISRYVAVSISLVLGLLSKPMMVTFPFALILLDLWPLRRLANGSPQQWWKSCREILLEKVPLILLSVVFCAITLYVQRLAGAVKPYPISGRISNALIAYVTYLGKAIWPVNLAAMYPHAMTFPVWKVVASATVLLLITVAALFWARKLPPLAVGWFWFIGTLVPMIGIIQVGDQAYADRYAYVTFWGLYLLFVWTAAALATRWNVPRPVLMLGVAAILAAFTVQSYRQTATWKNALTLWQHASEVNQDPLFRAVHLGIAYSGLGDPARAEEFFREAIALAPEDRSNHEMLGQTLLDLGRPDEAMNEYMLYPGKVGRFYARVGDSFFKAGYKDHAKKLYQQGIAKYPDDPLLHLSIGFFSLANGDTAVALKEFQEAKRLNPEIPSIDLIIEDAQRRLR